MEGLGATQYKLFGENKTKQKRIQSESWVGTGFQSNVQRTSRMEGNHGFGWKRLVEAAIRKQQANISS